MRLPFYHHPETPQGKTIGSLFILLAFLWLVAFARILLASLRLLFLPTGLPSHMNFLPFLFIYNAISISAGCALLLMAGFGLLQTKPWAPYLALLVPIAGLSHIAGSMWLFGPRYYGMPLLILFSLAYIFVLAFCAKEKYPAYFERTRTAGLPRLLKRGIIALLAIVCFHAVLIPAGAAYVYVRYRSGGNLKPQKTEYRITDEKFIARKCAYRNIGDIRIAIPDDWEIGLVSKEGPGNGWSVSFIEKNRAGLDAFLIVKSKALGKSLGPVGEALGFHRLYDFEKTINAPYRPVFCTILRTLILPSHLNAIDETVTPTWQGFIKMSASNRENIYDASLYRIRGKATAGITVMGKEKTLSDQQAKSIIASATFEPVSVTGEVFFTEGKAALARSDYTAATIAFINALSIDGKNAEYAYYLARSLAEDRGYAGRKPRLNSAKRFSDYALKLQPNHQQAKQLYRAVAAELKKTELNN
jgi:hypothetical protein